MLKWFSTFLKVLPPCALWPTAGYLTIHTIYNHAYTLISYSVTAGYLTIYTIVYAAVATITTAGYYYTYRYIYIYIVTTSLYWKNITSNTAQAINRVTAIDTIRVTGSPYDVRKSLRQCGHLLAKGCTRSQQCGHSK